MAAGRRLIGISILALLGLTLGLASACQTAPGSAPTPAARVRPTQAEPSATRPLQATPAPPTPSVATPATATTSPASATPPAVRTQTALPTVSVAPAAPSATAQATPSPTSVAEPAAPSPFGVAVRGEVADPAVQVLLAQAGVRWVRTSVNWAGIQPSSLAYNWAAFDGHLTTLAAAGVIPVVYISGNPDWAADSRCGPLDDGALPAFAEFVSTLVQRYDGHTIVNERTLPEVLYWQFYNEPDNAWTSGQASGFDGCWGADGAAYAQMLATAWTAVHAANPMAQVVFGGIAGESVDCPTTWECAGQPIFNFDINNWDFMDDVLEYMQNHPDSPYFDIFDFHYYPAFHTRWDEYGPGLSGKAEFYRQRLASWGVERPLMCSEAGRRSDQGQVIDRLPGSDEEQSRYVVRIFAQAMSSRLVNVLWFTLADIVEPKQTGAAAWGLLTQNLQPKPSYTAYRTLTQQLAGVRYKGATTFKGAEGYVFSGSKGETTVLWATSGSVQAGFKGSQVTVVDLYGEEKIVGDGAGDDADRKADGTVTLTVTQNPMFVRRQP